MIKFIASQAFFHGRIHSSRQPHPSFDTFPRTAHMKAKSSTSKPNITMPAIGSEGAPAWRIASRAASPSGSRGGIGRLCIEPPSAHPARTARASSRARPASALDGANSKKRNGDPTASASAGMQGPRTRIAPATVGGEANADASPPTRFAPGRAGASGPVRPRLSRPGSEFPRQRPHPPKMRESPCASRAKPRARARRRHRPPRRGPPPQCARRPRARAGPRNAERPRARDASGAFRAPARGGPRAIDERPPRARLPSLPRTSSAVLSATAGLTAGFGTGPGDPRLHGRARGGRSPAAGIFSLPRSPSRGDPGGRMAQKLRRRIAMARSQ